ncbi:aminotransferase class V-fold PLP-dependent enzyme [Planctomycetota bacterium]
MFGLETDWLGNNLENPSAGSHSMMMFNGRSCIYYLLTLLKCRRIWMPAYVCRSMVDAAKKAGVTIHFYSIDKHLQINDSSWIDKVKKTDIVLFVDYFGFSPERSIIKHMKDKGCIVVEDAAQSLLSQYKRLYTDYVIFSPRKLLGVPAGGILTSVAKDVDSNPLKPVPQDVLNATYQAFLMRTEFDAADGTDNGWFATYKQAEGMQVISNYAIDDFSQSLRTFSFDCQRIVLN